MAGMLIRVPLIGKFIGRALIPKIREMFEGMDTRDDYLDELIRAKKLKLQTENEELTDGNGFIIFYKECFNILWLL